MRKLVASKIREDKVGNPNKKRERYPKENFKSMSAKILIIFLLQSVIFV